MKKRTRRWSIIIMIGFSCTLASCASQHMTRTVPEVAPPPPPPPTEVFYYPLRNQGVEQQDRDRYECYLWAKKQTGFDPSEPQLAPHQRIKVIPQPAPGHDTAVGAVTGAIIGSVIMGHDDAKEGAIVGAMTGAMIGAASDTARQQEAESIQAQYDRRAARSNAQTELKASNYRRAMMACLEGRGYSVR